MFPQTEFIGRSEIEYLRWGGQKNGWDDLYLPGKDLDNVTIEQGPLGRLDILLEDNSLIEDKKSTEILLHFDRNEMDKIFFTSERYETESVDIFPSENIRKFGSHSAGFLYHHNSIKIKPLESSVFFKERPVPSFAIDFYLYPTSAYDEDTVFSWHVPVVELDGKYTGIKAYFENGKLVWLIENVFKNRGPGFNLPGNCTPMEYAVTHTEGIYTSWDKNQKVNQVENHLNYMGSQGWALVSAQKGSYSDEYVFFFARPTGR